MSTAPFTPGPEGSVIDDQEVSLSGAMEIDAEELGFRLRRGQVVEIVMRGEIVKTSEVDKTVSGGREVTVRQWGIKASSLQSLIKIADPAPRTTGDGQIPGQLPISDAGAPDGLSDADEKARMNPVEPPTGDELKARKAEIAAHEALSKEAVSAAPTAETLSESAQETDQDLTRVVYTLPNGEELRYRQRWINADGRTLSVQTAGTGVEGDVIVVTYVDDGSQDSYPPSSFGSTLARLDAIAPANTPDDFFDSAADPADNAPATSPDELKEQLS